MELKKIYFGVGCFWGSQAYFDTVKGVIETEVGYANGKPTSKKITYELVCSEKYKYVEIVKVVYDSNVVSQLELLDHFYGVVNPYTINNQGNDFGAQYKSAIYNTNNEDLAISQEFISNKQKEVESTIRIEVDLIKNYFQAEEYHQKYLEKNPGGYCHIKIPK